MKDYIEPPLFTREELSHIANKWMLWKGIAIGAIGMFIGLSLVGYFFYP